jgi:hypothetical protein
VDSNNELMKPLLLQDKGDVSTDEDEKFTIRTCHLCLNQLNVAPWHGCSRVGKRENMDRRRMAGALMLETEYFAHQSTQMAKTF